VPNPRAKDLKVFAVCVRGKARVPTNIELTEHTSSVETQHVPAAKMMQGSFPPPLLAHAA